jgi:hypothetical protein
LHQDNPSTCHVHSSGGARFALFHPNLVYHPRADEPDPSPHVGRDAYERLIRGFVESFVEVTFEVQELIDGTTFA